MWSASTVLMCALSVLGRDARTLPPIELVRTPPPDASRNAEAFTRSGTNVIYLIASSAAFERAQRAPSQCGDGWALAKIASVIVHEEWHLRHDFADENGAYTAQLFFLMKLGIGPGNGVYDSVWRSMRTVADQRRIAQRPVPADARLTGQPRWGPAGTPPSARLNRELCLSELCESSGSTDVNPQRVFPRDR